MTVPSVPADVSGGGAPSSAHMNQVLDVLAFLRDDLPVFKIEGFGGSDGQGAAVATGSNTEIEWSDGSGSFNDTPVINNGGFTAGTGAELGVYVPETGVYRVDVHADWASNSTGRRQINAEKEGSDIAGSFSTIDACSSSNTRHFSSSIVACTAGDEITSECFQNSGSSLACTFTLQITFLYAT